MTAGINRRTGKPLSGWDHVVQSLGVIFSTRFGDRIMRRNFGSAVPGLLGRNMVPSTVLRFYLAIAIAIELWEPRFRVRKFSHPGSSNSADGLGQGRLGIRIDGDYLPNALEGDKTVVIPQTLTA